MLSENIRAIRKAKGLSQEELADRIHVVRQTVSKWETGLSVPDADMLISLSEILETPVAVLLGSPAAGAQPESVQDIAEKLEAINRQLAENKRARLRAQFWLLLLAAAGILVLLAVLIVWKSPYLRWDYSDPETAVAGTLLHAFEFLFVRAAPPALVCMTAGCLSVRRKLSALRA